ncbi:MAG: AAA family ATPase [Richelia sp. RM2_1_2]|nr:AAA family ATPase [Richelia sp. RM2_1_2]
MYKHGFTLGKFLPPHNGHLHLIREAKKLCESLTVLVCSLKSEPIDGVLRHKWLTTIFENEPNIKFIHVTDEVPQYPHESPDFWNIWIELINRNVPEKEVFFSSEKYGDDVATHLNIDHVCIDLNRNTYPVSGTAIRNDPFTMWNFLHPIIRQYFVKRIVLTGAESVGKSTMIKYLTKHYNTNHVDEYGRLYCEIHKPATLYPVDFTFIAKKQIENEDVAAFYSNKILFCDTDLIVTEIYSRMYNNDCPQEIVKINKSRKYDLHLLLDVDLEFENDGTRIYLDPKRRQEHSDKIENALIFYGANYRKISGKGEDRFKNAINEINKYLNL